MEQSETIALLKAKITKILFLLLLVRLGLYIPVPNIDLDLFSQNQNTNPIFGFAKTLTGSSFLGIGALGILPYINASIIIQLLVPVLPQLEQLQKEEGNGNEPGKHSGDKEFVQSVNLGTRLGIKEFQEKRRGKTFSSHRKYRATAKARGWRNEKWIAGQK